MRKTSPFPFPGRATWTIASPWTSTCSGSLKDNDTARGGKAATACGSLRSGSNPLRYRICGASATARQPLLWWLPLPLLWFPSASIPPL